MTFYMENETAMELPFDAEGQAVKVIEYALKYLKCPYETEVDLLLTDNNGIQKINQEFRNIDSPTDVLSFPMVPFETPCQFSIIDIHKDIYISPDTNELLLGDIVISIDKVNEQAAAYNHSMIREFSFLIVHSILHLCGYDHMEDEERLVMEKEQENILSGLQINR